MATSTPLNHNQRCEGHNCPETLEEYVSLQPLELRVYLKTTVSCRGSQKVRRYLIGIRDNGGLSQRELNSTEFDHVRGVLLLFMWETKPNGVAVPPQSMFEDIYKLVKRSAIDSDISLPYISRSLPNCDDGPECKLVGSSKRILVHTNSKDRNFLNRLIIACATKIFNYQNPTAQMNITTAEKIVYYASHRDFLEHILKPVGYALSPETSRSDLLRGGEVLHVFVGIMDVYTITNWFLINAGMTVIDGFLIRKPSAKKLDDLMRKISIES